MVDSRTRRANLDALTNSGPARVAMQKKLREVDDQNLPEPTDEELIAIGDRADALNVYGFDAKQDRQGNWIEQGIGAKGRENINHFNSIRRYEGKEAYEAAVREIWKRDPARAQKIGLPQPPRASA